MTPLIKNLFDSRTKSFFDSDISLLGVLPETWNNSFIFPTYSNCKNIVETISFILINQPGIATVTPILKCKCDNLSFLVSSRPFPRLSRLHVEVRMMGQFGFSEGIPWLRHSDRTFCFLCKQDVESVTHFFLDCSYFKQNFLSLWRNLKLKITVSSQADGGNVCQFIANLDRHHKVLCF